MKKTISCLVAILLVAVMVIYQKPIVSFLLNNFIYKREISTFTANSYADTNDYRYVQHTNVFYPKNRQDIINILYTILDSGMDRFSFFCDEDYEACEKDMKEVSSNNELLSSLNNFVSPYNSYNKLFITTNSFGKITIEVEKLYTEDEILYINQQISNINKQILKDNMSSRDKIKAIHDYIINHTVYDESGADALNKNFSTNYQQSHKASGVLKNEIALCSGYTDLMALFLDNLKIPNFKISTTNHIWNAVFLDNTWYHLDLTWDDPVTSNHQNLLIYDFFLISSKQLSQKNTNQHNYNKNIYLELQ